MSEKKHYYAPGVVVSHKKKRITNVCWFSVYVRENNYRISLIKDIFVTAHTYMCCKAIYIAV